MGIFLINPYLYFVKPWAYGGETKGYVLGGFNQPIPATRRPYMYVFSMVSDNTLTYIGDLRSSVGTPLATSGNRGQHSDTHGYSSGGITPTQPLSSPNIYRFPFATNVPAPFVANLSTQRTSVCATSSETHGYSAGGRTPPNAASTVIDRFPFATVVNATNVASLVQGKISASTQVSPTDAYQSGGDRGPPAAYSPTASFTVQRFPFATNVNSVAVFNLTAPRAGGYGASSETHGYASSATSYDKFPFATNVNATSVASIFPVSQSGGTGQSSMTHGYVTHGTGTASRFKFSFATNTVASSLPSPVLAVGENGAGVHV